MVASVGADRTVRLWQPEIGRLVRFARLESNPLAVAWNADGSLLAVAAADGKVRVFDPATAEPLRELDALDGWAYTLAAAPDGMQMLVAGEDGQVRRVELVNP